LPLDETDTDSSIQQGSDRCEQQYADGLPVAINGAKAPSAGVHEVIGDKALLQRCTLHKRGDADHLPDMETEWVDAKLVNAFAHEQGLCNAAPRRPARQENLKDAQTLKEAMRSDRLRSLDQLASGPTRPARRQWCPTGPSSALACSGQ
jgi:hypothetical protein